MILKKIKLFTFRKKIELKNVHYNYPNSSRTTLKNLNISIPAKTTVGLVGATEVEKQQLLILYYHYFCLKRNQRLIIKLLQK